MARWRSSVRLRYRLLIEGYRKRHSCSQIGAVDPKTDIVSCHLPEPTTCFSGFEIGWAVVSSASTLILALSISLVSHVALAADYELFGAASKPNYYAVERFDHKSGKFYDCTASIDTETKKPTAQCTETPGVTTKSPAVKGESLQSTMTNEFDHVPQGFWQIDRISGKTEFCTLGSPQCVVVSPK